MHPSDYRPLNTHCWTVTAVAGCVVVASGLSLAKQSEVRLLQSIPVEVANWSLFVVVGLFGVAMLVWLRSASRNAKALGLSGVRFVNRAATLWLVPGVNLLVPFLTMRGLWRSSAIDPEDGTGSIAIATWWTLALTTIAAATLVAFPQLVADVRWALVRDGLLIVTVAVTSMLIHTVAHRQSKRHALVIGMPSFGLRDDHVDIIEPFMPSDAA